MAKQQPVALVFAGPVSRGSLGRLTGLRQHLTWVKSSSVATASRAIHALRRGRAVADYDDIQDATLVLISVPEPAIEPTVAALANSTLSWGHKTAVLYGTKSSSARLSRLARLGAETATLLYHPRPEQFLAEGTREALRAVRRLTGDVPLISVRDKEEYHRGMILTTDNFYPLLVSAAEAFRKAGMSKSEAEKTTAAMIGESARTWLRAGSRVFRRPAKPEA